MFSIKEVQIHIDRQAESVENMAWHTSSKQDLSLEEIFHLGIVVFCVGTKACPRATWLRPVNLISIQH